ncbi:MAG TPA: hypothetical protein VLB67_07490 [Acidimicrobiia bacterium]|nr:hypothetical protein [Acidimicrobiia bacterium]
MQSASRSHDCLQPRGPYPKHGSRPEEDVERITRTVALVAIAPCPMWMSKVGEALAGARSR